MKRMTLSVAALLLAATPAIAQDTGGMILNGSNGHPEFDGGFSNKGQCVSALAQTRNAQRKDPTTRGGAPYDTMTGGQYNKASLTTTRCEEIDGRWHVVYYMGGFPDDDDDDGDDD